MLGALAMGLLGSVSLFIIDPRAKHVDWSGGAAFELRGGLAPLFPGDTSEPALRLTVAPFAVFAYEDRVRGRELSLEYAPQIYMRISERYFATSQVRRPLFFHQLRARYAGELSRRLSWQGAAGASIGELDYSLQAAQLGVDLTAVDGAAVDGGQQGALLEQPVVQTAGVSASVGLTGQLSRLHTLTLQPSVTVQRLLPGSSLGTTPLVFDQTSADLTLSHGWVASRIDTLTSSVVGGYADFGTNGAQAYTSLDVAWRRRLRPRLDGQLRGGGFFTVQVEGTSPRGTPALPLLDVLLVGRVLERSRLRIITDVNVGTQAYFDPVQGSVLPLGGGGLSLRFVMPPDLTAGIEGSFYTPPLPPTQADIDEAATPAIARTTLSLRTPVSYQIDRNYAVEAGTIVTARGPHLGVEGVERFPQTEFWLYVAFRLGYTTSRRTSE